jgi:gamma-glutamyltranspeptidase/glutathione hydrolase
MLRILEPYDLAALGHNSAPYLHRLIEAKKLAFADLDRYVGDPAAMKTPGFPALLRQVHRSTPVQAESEARCRTPGAGAQP